MIRAHQQSSERCLANTTSGNSHLRPIDVYSFGILVATVFNQTEPGDLSSSAVLVGVLGGQLRTELTKPTSGCNLATSCMLAQVRAFGDAGVGAEGARVV